MQVILLERIRKLGQMGDVVNVKDGFARNFLLPQKKALRATDDNRTRFESEKSHLQERNSELKSEAEKVSSGLDGQTFVLLRQAGESGQLYGSVTTRDIAAVIAENGFAVARSAVSLDKPIKDVGLHKIEIVLHADVIAGVTINVARTKDEAERQARGEAILAPGQEGEEALLAAEEIFEKPPAVDTEDAAKE